MAVTEDRLRTPDEKLFQELEDEWARRALDDLDRGNGHSPTDRRSTQQGEHEDDAPRRWSRRLLVAWALVLTPLFVFAPAPDDPEASLSGLGLAVTVAFMTAFFVMLAGLGRGARWGFGASAAAASIGVVSGVACAATGHHQGGWWAYETAAFGGLVAFTWLASRDADHSGAPPG